MHHPTITMHHPTTTMHHPTTLASFPRAPAHFHLQITVVTSSFRCWPPHTCLLTLMGASWGQRPHLTCSNLLGEFCWKALLTLSRMEKMMGENVHALHLCLTLCDPMDCSPPGFSVHRILQARILEWVTTPSFKGSWGIQLMSVMSPALADRLLTTSTNWEAHGREHQ